MPRALETADIIHKHLPDLPRESDALLCEGAPIPPEPPVGHWKPEKHVNKLHCNCIKIGRVNP